MNFNEELTKRVSEVNKNISVFMPEEAGFQETVITAMNYSVNAGGKRIRPLIMEETFKLCNGTNENILKPFMAALEFIHTYSLVHDDLPAMDNDDYRRGQLTTHKKFGEDVGILAGDGLLNYAYETMVKAFDDCDSESVQSVVKACKVLTTKAGIYGMVGGQTLDVLLTDKPMNAEQMKFIFDLKTGALIEAAFMIGGILAGANRDTINVLAQVGNKVGVVFQIQDDILDVSSTQEVLGKPVFSDEKNNKTTYVTLYGMDKARADVESLSIEALDMLKKIGKNEFLENLIIKLINRDK